MQNQILLLSGNKDCVVPYRSGVSLHGHTRHSQESLGFIGKFLERHGLTRRWMDYNKEQCQRITGVTLDFERAYWTPPLCERQAQELEERQIEELGLHPMVSLTDHNSIEACLLLRGAAGLEGAPISTEWTVPFGSAVFHVGVHNLPLQSAPSLMAAMHEATANGDERQILVLLAELFGIPEVLLVFNHPVWNFMDLPRRRFNFELTRFLASSNEFIHAFELNGMRGHRENREVMELAADWDQVLISGGDRHGCEPNAWLNLSNAADFAEFVDEVRNGRESTVLIMPQYCEPLGWRFFRNFTHVVADYPDHPEGRRKWDERTFHPDRTGAMAPMSSLWRVATPEFLKTIFALAVTASRAPVDRLVGDWMKKENQTLLAPPTRRWAENNEHATVHKEAGERIPAAYPEDCLYARGGEPAAD